MRITSHIIAAAVAAGLAWPAVAEEDAADGCTAGARPVVSEGLPQRPCAGTSGVVVNRGPAITPEPSEAGAAWAPTERAPRTALPADPFGLRRPVLPVYPALPRLRHAPGFDLVLRSGDVFLRIGDGKGRPWPRSRGHGRRHDGGGRGHRQEQAQGFSWPQPPQ